MKSFRAALKNKIEKSVFNNFGIENYDIQRFGSYPFEEFKRARANQSVDLMNILKTKAKKIIRYKSNQFSKSKIKSIENYIEKLQLIWEQVNKESKDLLVDIMAYRILGYKKIKLPTNNRNYRKALEKAKLLKINNDIYDPHFMHFILEKFDLNAIGFNIKLYFSEQGIAIDFIIEQYAYKINNRNVVSVEEGDIVLDVGACWGDTALYFAEKTGNNGKVYSFEFIPDNIRLFDINRSLNPALYERIELVKHPVSDKTGENIFFKDDGPGSRIEVNPFKDQTGSTTTITIDYFLQTINPVQINFIKMDIEGAELPALRGAIETIRKYKPKLAIAIYHSMSDFVDIPLWIASLNLGYKMYIGHYTIHQEETIIFASC